MEAFTTYNVMINPPFHWTAIPPRIENLMKMTRVVAETARAQWNHSRSAQVVVEANLNFRFYIERIQKRNGSVSPTPRS